MVIVAARLPAAFRLVPQLLEPETMVKSVAGLGLPTDRLVTVAALVFVRVIFCAALVAPTGRIANARPDVDSLMAGAVATFCPVRLTTCVPLPALSVKAIEA